MKVLIFLVVCLASVGACSEDSPGTPKDAAVDTPADASCFTNPQTHDEIINACTTAQQIYRESNPPLLNADGTLPALP